MNNDWTDIFRDKLAEHEMTPPENLWQDIESAMPNARQTSRRKIAWPSAVAACALFIIGVTLFFRFEEQLPPATIEETPTNAIAQEEAWVVEESIEIVEENTTEAQPQKSATTASRAGKKSKPAKKEEKTQTEHPAEKIPAVTEEKTAEQRKEETPTSSVVTNKNLTQKDSYARNYSRSKKNSDKKSRGMTLNLYAANIPAPSLSGTNNDVYMNDLTDPGGNGQNLSSSGDSDSTQTKPASLPMTRAAAEDRTIEAKHHRPVRIGVSFAYPLTEQLSLTSGISFARLTSDFTYFEKNISFTKKQKLTYIGIPLGATYRVVEYKAMSLYLSGGGMIEQCISGEEKRPQFSVFGGGGLEILLGKTLSIFAEPRVSYYPNNHSSIDNYYKDRPATFDLNLGVRFILKK